MRKCDIVCTFYKEEKYVPYFFWGLKDNLESINEVYVVPDGLPSGHIGWDCYELARGMALKDRFHMWAADRVHEAGSHGVALCMNKGIGWSKADYVFLTTFDQILAPGALADILELAAPRRMVIGRVDSIAMDTTIGELPNPRIIRPDMYDKEIPALQRGEIFGGWRNGHTLVHRQSHIGIGGFDEHFVNWGYGLEDQDYCIRWILEYGLDSIKWGDSNSWHFAGDRPSAEDPKKYNWHPEAVKVVNDNLHKLYVKYDISKKSRKYYQRVEEVNEPSIR